MDTTASSPELILQNLRPLIVLGTGAMGTVFLVHDHLNDFNFALKVVEKCSGQATPETSRRSRWEISVLERLVKNPHPFLPSLIGSIETEQMVAWGIPFCSGGDLNVLRRRQTDGVFSPASIRFYAAEIVCALKHLHTMGIVYRDLKPENILVQDSGHVTLTDFDLSRDLPGKSLKSLIQMDKHKHKHRRKLTRVKLKKPKSARVTPMTRRNASFSAERSNSFVGTEEYVAPEMVTGDGHEFAVDWWALGILCYEMMFGTTPFLGKNRKDTFGRILNMPVKFTGKPSPLTDLIEKLLDKDPTSRLGYARGASEIQEHPFFAGLQWDLLTEVVRPPVIPGREDGQSAPEVGSLTVTEYLQKLRESPARDECKYNASFNEF